MKLRDMPIGTRYGQLTLLRHLPPPKYGAPQPQGWWRCDCGKEKMIRIVYVKSGHSRSCGCASQKAMRGMQAALSNENLR